jgi:hypothetical protein
MEYIQQELFNDRVYVDLNNADVYDVEPSTGFFISFDRNVLNKIKHECSDILNIYKKDGLLYRGIKKNDEHKISDGILKIIPHTNRTPKDTPLDMHKALDRSFKKHFGWKARSEGVFVSGNIAMAAGYGNVGIFFPKNGFKYVWSPNFEDLYTDFIDVGTFNKEVKDFINKEFIKYIQSLKGYVSHREIGSSVFVVSAKFQDMNGNITRKVYDDESEEYIEEYDNINRSVVYDEVIEDIIRLDYCDTDLKNAIKSNNEVMFKCSDYYILETPQWRGRSMNEELLHNLGLT